MSIALACPLPAALYENAPESCVAVGSQSVAISHMIKSAKIQNELSVFRGWRAQLRSQISELLNSYGAKGWDGAEAEPISTGTASVASALVDSLPDGVIVPEVTPEIDGTISLDWTLGKNRILSVSVSPAILTYAAIVGMRKIHGETPVVGELPNEVKNILPGYFTHIL